MALSVRVAVVMMLALPIGVAAQETPYPNAARTALSLNVGRFDYDFAATGKTFAFATRLERSLSRYVIGEGGILFARPTATDGDEFSVFIPELQVQVQLPLRVAPYLGLGGGIAWEPNRGTGISNLDRSPTDPTLSVSAGARAWIASAVGLRVELRQRWIGGIFSGSSSEWTVGLAVRDPR